MEDIEQLQLWEDIWLLKFNPSKCKVIHVNHNDNPGLSYSIDGTELGVCDQEKDLGVVTSSSLLWTDHIKSSISKANQMICWIARSLITRDRLTMITVYKSLIRPHLEYCVQLWNPATVHGNWTMILELEGVQRRFTRLIDEVGTLPYSERLDILKLTTLAERRCRGDLIETFKAVNGKSSISGIFKIGRSGINLVSDQRVSKGNTRVQNLSKNFLTNRVIQYWNILPLSVKMSESVESFKVNLQHFKVNNVNKGCVGQFWDISYEVLSRIEGSNYLKNKAQHNEFLKLNPYLAKKKFINLS